MTAVKVQFEIGHEASIRTKKTQQGFTHDWEVFVRGQGDADISHFVEKVVFHLHVTFPKPKRVVKEPPFSIKESGYAGFNLPIEIYVKNKDEPKKIQFNYDLHLPENGPATYNFLKDRYIFQNPNEEFKKKLLKGGGIIVSNSAFYTNPDQESRSRDSFSDEKHLVSKPKLSSDGVKKHKAKEHKDDVPHRTSSFVNLFGQPLQKPPKISPDPKKIEKSIVSVKSEKKDKDRSSSEKVKSKHESKEIKIEKVKIKEEKDRVKLEKNNKSHKDSDRSKERSNKRPSDHQVSPENIKRRCPSPNRRPPSPPPRSNSASSMKEEYKPSKTNHENAEIKKPVKTDEKPSEVKPDKEGKEKKKKDKKSHARDKERKEKSDHKKEGHKSVKEQIKEPLKELPKDIPKAREVPKEKEIVKELQVKEKPLKQEKPFNKFSIENLRKTPQDTAKRLDEHKIKDKNEPEKKHKHKKKDKKRDESREKHKESNKEKKHKQEKIRESVPEKVETVERRETPIPKEKALPEPASPISLDTASQCSSKSSVIKMSQPGIDDGNTSQSESEGSILADEEADIKIKVENPSPEPVKEQIPSPEPEPEPEPNVEPIPVPSQHKEKSKKHKDKSLKREEKRRKRKAAEEEEAENRKVLKTSETPVSKTDSEIGESSGITIETKVQDNGVSSSLGEDAEPGELSPDYMVQLRELQQRIMTIKSNEELERVVNLIAETGRYEVTTQTFDFDLCLLDRSTVQQLIQLVGC